MEREGIGWLENLDKNNEKIEILLLNYIAYILCS